MTRNPIERILFILLFLMSCQNLTTSFGLKNDYNELKINQYGKGKFNQSTIKKESQPQLAYAYEQGSLPKQPIIGPSYANWARTLEVHLQEDGNYIVTAKALAPYPIELLVIEVKRSQEIVLARASSKIWTRGVYFAQTKLTLELTPDQLWVLRTSGNEQITNNLLKLTFNPQ